MGLVEHEDYGRDLVPLMENMEDAATSWAEM